VKEPVEEPTANTFTLSFGYEGGKEELFVESDSIVKLELKTNPSTGYSWHFVNEDEVKGLGYIELQDDTYQSACANNPRLKGCGGTCVLLFYIRNASKELPKLHLVYKRSLDVENYGEVVVTLKSDENKLKEMTKKLKTIDSTKAMKETLSLTVENTSILNIEISDSTSHGNQWILGNLKNLQKYYSHLVEFEKSSIEMVCNEKEECERVKTFTFRIKNASKKLPKLDFIYTLNETKPSQQEYIIYLQGAVLDGNENECPVDNYNCCTNANAKIIYTDSLGDWGIEKSRWCFINRQFQCFSERLGYRCCSKGVKVVLIDQDGSWGVENKK